MAVASGQLPYQYEWPVPFRVRHNSDQGLSGIHLEAAQFVMQAEMRKFNQLDAFLQQWEVRTNEAIPGSGYDPKPNGNTLNGLVGPKVVAELDQISLMRSIMIDGVLGVYSDFCPYSRNILLDDWIKNTYKESPSGNGQTSTDDFQGQFLRPILQEDGAEYIPGVFGTTNPVLGLFTETDPHWLGGSGIILDIDVGEVMWNPYPLVTDTIQVDTHGTSDNWFILANPFYPMFQKTDGSLISLNGLENKWPEDRVVSSLVNNYAAVGSGKVRYTGYCYLAATEFLFGAMDTLDADVHHIAFSTDQMSVFATSARAIGNATKNVFGSDVFLTPIPLSSGVYRVAARNTKVNFPFTTIESGVASQWPFPTDITSAIGNVETSYYGYEVFNNAFWITDAGIKNNNTVTITGPSGLSLVSPYTGKLLWQRNATNDILGVFYNKIDFVTPAEFFNVYWWDDNDSLGPLTLQRTGTNQLVRWIGRDAPMDPGVDFTVSVATLPDDMTSVSTQSVTLSVRANNDFDHFTDIFTAWFDGSSWWVTGHAFNSFTNTDNSFTWELDSGFSEIRRISGSMGQQRRLGSGNGKRLAFGGPGDDLNIIEWSDAPAVNPEGASITVVATKAINITGFIPGTLEEAQIINIIEITGFTPELANGIYAYARIQTSTAANKLYILEIEEQATEWTVKGLWSIRAMLDGVEFGNMANLIVMPVD